MYQAILITLLIVVSVFMILLILVQRGRGGGLAGAFGGAGGQSAFGTKAGDTFTVITIATAIIWFSLCIITLMVLKNYGSHQLDMGGGRIAAPTSTAPISAPADSAPSGADSTGGSSEPAN